MKELPVACTLDESTLASRKNTLLDGLFKKARVTNKLEQGYLFVFDASDETLDVLHTMIKQERACCRFLQFRLTLLPDGGPVSLEVTGPEGTVAFLNQLLPKGTGETAC